MKILVLVAALGVGAELSSSAPLGLDAHMPVPASNPLTPEKVKRGRQLFFDTRLSRDRTVSCATCHDPKQAFAESRAITRGIGGAAGTRNTPTVINRGYGRLGFWDGRAEALEQQVLLPILNPIELGLTEKELESRTGMTVRDVTFALASYIRTIRSGNSRFDRFTAGDAQALNALERQGLQVFRGKGACAGCHNGPLLTDELFHNTGVAWRNDHLVDDGRFAVSLRDSDNGAFKTPTLRDIAATPPYMHDGSIATLEEVVDFYAQGGRQNPWLSPFMRPRPLTADEKTALVAFLRSLSGAIEEGLQ